MQHSGLLAVSTAAAVAVGLLPATPAQARSQSPAAITTLTAAPGLRPGEIIVRWQSTGANTDRFVLETALTAFSPTDPTLPLHGRGARTYVAGPSARSITLTATQTAAAGAGLGTGNFLHYLLYAVHSDATSTVSTVFPKLQGMMPRGLPAAKASGTKVRAATFNVRTAKATTDARPWLKRAPSVAGEIVRYRPGVVGLQELSPARADGKKASTKGKLRQTTSLLAALRKAGGSQYRLVRTTPYVKSGSPSGSQGTRILYDADRYRLLSRCPQTTSGHSYNSSCTIKLPLLAGDSEKLRRRAAYALLEDRKTKRKFFVISAHLDQRHTTALPAEARYNQLRGTQAAAIDSAIAKLNPKRRKVIFAGDLNSWQTNKAGHAPHDVLVAKGYFDTASAALTHNMAYGTSNAFAPVLRPNPYGFGTRIDAVLVKGTSGANWFANITKVNDSARPSDHSLVFADLVL